MDSSQPTARTLLVTTALLFALYGTSWFLSYRHLGNWSIPIALGIACCKSLLILTVFMRVHRQPVANRIVVCTAIAMVLILVGFVALDAVRR